MQNFTIIKQWRLWDNPISWILLLCTASVGQTLEYERYSDPQPVVILNSPYRETNLSFSPNGSCLYFMSDRGGQPWSQVYSTFKGQVIYDGDLWVSCRNEKGEWEKPQVLPPPINTPMGEDEPNLLHADTLVFQSWREDWATTEGPYYLAVFQDGHWRILKGLGGGITRFFQDSMSHYKRYATDGAILTRNGRYFLFAAGPIYDQPMDLYLSILTDTGWSYPTRLPISTSGDERSLFLYHNTLFFASNSYGGYGGLDIFCAQLDTTFRIQSIYNLGTPFNTEADEYGFILSPDSSEAYFVRNGDIYSVSLNTFLLKGKGRENETLSPTEIYHKVDLFFEFDVDTLPPSELQKLENYRWGLLHARIIRVEGHTDTTGTSQYNEKLSLRRALFVKNYLVRHFQVPESKIAVTAYGERKAIPSDPSYSRRVSVLWTY